MNHKMMPTLNESRETRLVGSRMTPLVMAAGLTALALTLSGCEQGLGGGAYYEPQVRIRPDADAVVEVSANAGSEVTVAGYGNLKGRIVLDGAAPPNPPIKPSKDAYCIGKSPVPGDRVVVGEGNGLANVFVYLPKVPGGSKSPESPEPAKFDQQSCRFVPHCLTVHTDQTILVLNSDNTLHNTHTNPQRQPAFNQGVAPNTKEGVPLVYKRSEKVPVNVICDIHPWMLAFHLPLDHPYSAVSGDDGSFEIPNLPAGTHKFTVWHEVSGIVTNSYPVEITVDGTTEVEIKVPAQSLSRFQGARPRRVILSTLP